MTGQSRTDSDRLGPINEPIEDHLAEANGVRLAYNSFGDSTDPALLLVMGLGTQMIAWSDEMCERLTQIGFFVVRYDNRDVGLSTHFNSPAPTLARMVSGRGNIYTVADMARDGLGLLDSLGIGQAHVMGASMGGFIAQTMALIAPTRVSTLSLIMTSTGSRRVGRPTPRVVARMARRPAASSREEAMREAVASYRVIGSPGITDLDQVAELAGRAFDRSHDPAGTQRQLAAIMAQPNRTSDLREITVPTLVMHGLRDPLVSATGGIALARAIKGSRFVGLQGYGHDLPRTAVREIEEEFVALAAKV